MKVSNKQYAQALFEATKGKDEKDLKHELKNFTKVLAINGDLSKIDAILSEFEKVWQTEEQTALAEVVSADRLEAETLDALKDYVTSETGAKKVILKHSVDQELLAGFILRFGDQIVDGSAKNMISSLKKEIIK